mgnify:CR=1 FL=1
MTIDFKLLPSQEDWLATQYRFDLDKYQYIIGNLPIKIASISAGFVKDTPVKPDAYVKVFDHAIALSEADIKTLSLKAYLALESESYKESALFYEELANYQTQNDAWKLGLARSPSVNMLVSQRLRNPMPFTAGI